MRAGVHAHASLACEKEQNQQSKEQQIGCEGRKQKETNAIEEVAWTKAFLDSAIVVPTAAAARWAPVHRGFSADSRLFPFRFRWGMRKG
jgi:hypothetical protein